MTTIPFPKNYWQGHKRAAISLTYDDGYVSNLDVAVPQLESAGFRGTFYLYTTNSDVTSNIARWKKAFHDGHDIGNHSSTHPCGARLVSMTKQELEIEIGNADQWLNTNIGVDEFRSYAYPCGELRGGGLISDEFRDMYLEVVKKNFLFSRLGGGPINNDYGRLSIDQHEVQGKAVQYPHGTNVDEFIKYCESALASGGWGVIIFHGIGDTMMPTDANVHQELVDYLKNNVDKYWVAPFKDVAKFIRDNPNI